MTTPRLLLKFLPKGVRSLYTKSCDDQLRAHVEALIAHHPELDASVKEDLNQLLKNIQKSPESPVENIYVGVHEEKIAGKVVSKEFHLDILRIHPEVQSSKSTRHR